MVNDWPDADLISDSGNIAALHRDLFTISGDAVRDVHVDMTIVGGAVRYQRVKFECP